MHSHTAAILQFHHTTDTNTQIPFYPLLTSHIQNVTSRTPAPCQGSHTTSNSITLLLIPLCPPYHTSSSLSHHHHLTQTHTQLQCTHPHSITRKNSSTQPHCNYPHNTNRTQLSSSSIPQHKVKHSPPTWTSSYTRHIQNSSHNE